MVASADASVVVLLASTRNHNPPPSFPYLSRELSREISYVQVVRLLNCTSTAGYHRKK